MDAYLRYSGKAIIDCTNFAAMSPEDPLGYLCGGDVLLYSDGTLQICLDDPKNVEAESFSVQSIVRADNNINGSDPEYQNTVSIMTEEKSFHFTFLTAEDKKKFWDALTDTYVYRMTGSRETGDEGDREPSPVSCFHNIMLSFQSCGGLFANTFLLSHDYPTFIRLPNFHTITFTRSCPKKLRKSKNAPVETTPPGHSTFCNRVKEAENSLDTREYLSKGGERKILTQL